MRLLVAILTFISLAFAGLCFLFAKSAVHEILGAIFVLCFMVGAVGMAVLSALEEMSRGKTVAPKTVLTATGKKTI